MSDVLGSRDILYPENFDRFSKKELFQHPQAIAQLCAVSSPPTLDLNERRGNFSPKTLIEFRQDALYEVFIPFNVNCS